MHYWYYRLAIKGMMDKIKLIFFVGIIIGAFILVPNLGKDLVMSCVTAWQGIDHAKENLNESMKGSPIIR